MNREVYLILEWYQKAAMNAYRETYMYSEFGYKDDTLNCLLGIIFQMSRMYNAVKQRDNRRVEDIVQTAIWYLAVYCEVNKISLANECSGNLYEMWKSTEKINFEDFAEAHRKELTLEADMSIEQKVQFIQKTFVNLFPPNSPVPFLDSMLRMSIVNRKK